MTLAFFCVYMPNSEECDVWFQRSGSIIVLLNIFVQYKLSNLNTFFDANAYAVPIEIPNGYKFFYKCVVILNIAIILTGTIIWGYGDMFF